MCASPSSVVVGTESTLLVGENTARSGLFIRNLSANIIYLGFDHDAVVEAGLVLYPNESFSMTPNDYCSSHVMAVASKANSLVAIQEFSIRSV